MNRRGYLPLALVIPALLWGCAGTPTEPVPWQQVRAEIPAGMARLYVAIRPSSGAAGAQLYINDEFAAWMREAGCSTYVVAAGRIQILSKSTDPINRLLWGKSELSLDVAPGDIVFVDVKTGFFGSPELQRVDTVLGEQLIQKIGNCVRRPFDVTSPVEAVNLVSEALDTIEHYYVDEVESQSVLNGCLVALPTDPAASAEAAASGNSASKKLETALARVPVADLQKVTDACVSAMVKKLDPHSMYFKRSETQGARRRGESAMAGVGLELTSTPDGPRIIGVTDGSPAELVGLGRADLLVAVGDVDLRGRPLEDVIEALRGAPDSSVSLAIIRAGQSEPMRFDLKRKILSPVLVHGRLVEPDVAYLQLAQLGATTPDQLIALVSELRKDNNHALAGLILDLRWCPGGLLITAGAVATVLLPSGSVVAETKGRSSGLSTTLRAEPKDYASLMHASFASLPDELKSVPIVVLVGPKTAAGAEIIAAALRHHRHALLVGASTAGVNRVQVIFGLPHEASLKLTTQRIYLADGKPLEESGLAADVAVDPPSLPKDALPPPTGLSLKEVDPVSDPELRRAISILKGPH